MGTNYYFLEPNPDYDEQDLVSSLVEPKFIKTHIGKSSMGWCFSLHVYPELHIRTLENWKNFIKNYQDECYIINEYNESLTKEELYDIIENRERLQTWEEFEEALLNNTYLGRQTLEDFLYQNEAIKGPKNLLRHKIGNHCIGHGEGTYDYIVGYFL